MSAKIAKRENQFRPAKLPIDLRCEISFILEVEYFRNRPDASKLIRRSQAGNGVNVVMFTAELEAFVHQRTSILFFQQLDQSQGKLHPVTRLKRTDSLISQRRQLVTLCGAVFVELVPKVHGV
jgi:hypothetical protein